MYAVSQRFLDAVAGKVNAQVAVDLAIRERGQRIATPALHIQGGSVIADAHDSTGMRASLRIVNPDGSLVPAAARDLLSPLSGRTFVPYRGFRFSDGTTELVPQGEHMLVSTDAETTSGGTLITLTGQDRASRAIAENKYVEKTPDGHPPGYVGPGIDIAQVLHDIAVDRAPGLAVQYTASGFASARTIPNVGDDPWTLMKKFATSIGYEMLSDNDGVLSIGPILDPNRAGAVVVWHYVDDKAAGSPVVRKLNVTVTRDGVFSGSLATGQNSFGLTPPSALVWDTDPGSPTYYLGPFGKVPDIMAPDEKLVTFDQCTAAATGNLNAKKGLPQALSIDQYVNPALQPRDVVRVDFERLDLAALYALDRVEVPFGLGDSMPVTARERRIA